MDSSNSSSQSTQKNRPPRKPFIYYYTIALCCLIAFNLFIVPSLQGQGVKQVGYDQFIAMVEDNQVHQVEVNTEEGLIAFTTKTPEEDVTYYETGYFNDPQLADRLLTSGVAFERITPTQPSPILTFLLTWILPMVLLIGGGQFMLRSMQKRMGGSNTMSFGKSNAKVYVAAQSGKTFADVAGEEEAKEALQEIVDFLHNPEKYAEIGAKLPKGALLVGPPGTGKTLLAQAVAGEADVPFFSISGSEFVEMFVGMGAARVRDLFKQAGEKAPCIVFIDEIDAIGKRRDGTGMGGNDEREQTLNQLLTEMDGFDSSKGVVILAATNRPETLDKALLRPGRFDRRIPVDLPDLKGREAILKVHAAQVKTDGNINYNEIARATAGTSGAELANIVNEGALMAVKNGRNTVSQQDLNEAVEIVIAGYQRKGAVISPKEKLIVAYHEIGHALVAANLKGSAPVHKVTIVPRTSGALGYTMQVPEEESLLMTKEEALDRVTTLTGGRAAEELIFNTCTSGASNDIEQATKMARAMITRLGMSETFDMMALETINNQYLGGDASLMCSADTAAKVDQEVLSTIKSSHKRARSILEENIGKLHELAKFLLERETITGEEFMHILSQPVAQLTGTVELDH